MIAAAQPAAMPSASGVGEPVLAVSSLRLGYGPRTVVADLSLEVRAGECVAVVGANGAGKSTTLRAIAGLGPVRGGSIRLDGTDVTGWNAVRAVRAGVVLCPEGRHLFPGMSIRDNLLLGLAAQRLGAAERAERLDEVETLFPLLRERPGQLAGTLSGGEQQMVALGRALVSRPKVLILDEPSLGLSPLMVEQVFGVISEIVTSERAVLLAEQNVEASLANSQRAYILESGRLTQSGSAAEMLASPDLLKAFLG